MVKGISKRVVLVKAPPNTMFEEAIFILKEEALAGGGVDADEILKQAYDAAASCTGKTGGRISKKVVSSASLVGIGAMLTGLFWILSAAI